MTVLSRSQAVRPIDCDHIGSRSRLFAEMRVTAKPPTHLVKIDHHLPRRVGYDGPSVGCETQMALHALAEKSRSIDPKALFASLR